MRTIKPAQRANRSIVCAVVGMLMLGTLCTAQVTAPTPQSVAPGYVAPSTQPSYYQYVPTRAGTWDFNLNVGYWMFDSSSKHVSNLVDGFGNNLNGNFNFKFKDQVAWGFGAAYHFTEQLSGYVGFNYSNPDMDVSYTDEKNPANNFSLSGASADIWTGDLAVQYDLLKGQFRPFVRGSIGFMYIDTNIPTGWTQYYWWPTWWGTYVAGYTPTASSTWFTAGATGGVRYDFSKDGNGVYLEASYTANWANTSSKWLLNQRVQLAVGWNY